MATATAVAPKAAPKRGRHLAAAPAPSLRSVVAVALRDAPEADPHTVVDGLIADLSPDMLAEAARTGLGYIAAAVVRDERNRPALSNPAGRSGKWEAAAQHRDVLAYRIWTGSEWKFLRDCTKADLEGAAQSNRDQATALVDNAERYQALARKLRKSQTVAELKRTVVEGIFNG